jgi:type IX secretion system PorP/SprF family membrane protein
MIKKLLISFSVFLCIHIYGQDPHFSQFYVTPSFTNPALTGFFKGTVRAHAIYKSQWEFVTDAYSTVGAGADFSILKEKLKWSMMGVGLNIVSDLSGSTHLNTHSVNLPFSYTQRLTKISNHYLSVGFMPSFNIRSINLAKATFDDQFNGIAGFEGVTSESQITNNKIYFNLGLGALWFSEFSKKANVYAGISMFNFTKPNISLIEGATFRIPVRINANLGGQFKLTDNVALLPSLQFQKQAQYNEMLAGTFVSYNLTNQYSANQKLILYGGLWYRYKDALIPTLRLDLKNYTFTFNYDVNISKYTKASRANGGPEISIVFKSINKKEEEADKRREKMGCPFF